MRRLRMSARRVSEHRDPVWRDRLPMLRPAHDRDALPHERLKPHAMGYTRG